MFDEHENGQLRMGVAGEQLAALPLPVNEIPSSDGPALASPALAELARCEHCGGEVVAGSTCPRSIDCPACRGVAGGPCYRPSGHRAAELHAARVELAERMG